MKIPFDKIFSGKLVPVYILIVPVLLVGNAIHETLVTRSLTNQVVESSQKDHYFVDPVTNTLGKSSPKRDCGIPTSENFEVCTQIRAASTVTLTDATQDAIFEVCMAEKVQKPVGYCAVIAYSQRH